MEYIIPKIKTPTKVAAIDRNNEEFLLKNFDASQTGMETIIQVMRKPIAKLTLLGIGLTISCATLVVRLPKYINPTHVKID